MIKHTTEGEIELWQTAQFIQRAWTYIRRLEAYWSRSRNKQLLKLTTLLLSHQMWEMKWLEAAAGSRYALYPCSLKPGSTWSLNDLKHLSAELQQLLQIIEALSTIKSAALQSILAHSDCCFTLEDLEAKHLCFLWCQPLSEINQ